MKNISGICTFCISQDRDFIVGYLLKDGKALRILLTPSKSPPKMHKCVSNNLKFYDLKVVEMNFSINNVQSNNQEYLQFTTRWNESVQDKRTELDSAAFSPLLIKIGQEGKAVIEIMFPAFVDDSDCTICVGQLEIKYED
jgi:hypothetical protein